MTADENGKDSQEKDKKAEPIAVKEQTSKTKHKITINNKELKYTVTAGTLLLKEEQDDKGETPKATIFYIAYSLDGVKDQAKRPITFSFNGGPGSSSVWLHLGVLGPRRVLMDEDGIPPPPPYQLVDNEYSILDQTDLVFIDPVSTGYSRAVPGEKSEVYHDAKKDIESIGEFIRLYTSRNKRWASPKFLIGESYGTTRAAGLSGFLQEKLGMYLNGIMLISSILNFQTASFLPGNDLPHILFLPTFAATAWYHQKLSDDLQKDLRKTLDMVEEFAMGEYTLALMQGSALPTEERKVIIKKLAQFTGLAEKYIDQTDLRINIHRFIKEICREDGITVGRLDSRYTNKDRDNAGEFVEFDPSYAAIQGIYTAAFNQYVREDLEFASFPALIIYYLFQLVNFNYAFVHSFLLASFWIAGMYFSNQDEKEENVPQSPPLKLWPALIGLPMLVMITLNYIYLWTDNSIYTWGVSIITLIALVIIDYRTTNTELADK